MAPTYVAFFREGLGYTERAGAMPRWLAIAGSALDPGALATFASPYLTALKLLPRNSKLWPGSDISMADVYIGVLPFILSLLALAQRPRSIWRWWLLGIIVFFLVCAVGDRLPVRGWLYDYCPPTRYFAYPAMFRGYAIFSAAVLALLATSDLKVAIQNAETRIWWQLAVLSLAASIASVWAYVHVVSRVANLGDEFHLSNLHLAGIWFGAVGVSLLLLFFWRHKKMASDFIRRFGHSGRSSHAASFSGLHVRRAAGRVRCSVAWMPATRPRMTLEQSSARVEGSRLLGGRRQ